MSQPTFRIQSSDSPTPTRDDDWAPFVAPAPEWDPREWSREAAIDLCRKLASAKGTQCSWRILEVTDGVERQILLISGGGS